MICFIHKTVTSRGLVANNDGSGEKPLYLDYLTELVGIPTLIIIFIIIMIYNDPHMTVMMTVTEM